MMKPRHYLQFSDFSRAEYEYLLQRTRWIKAQFKQYRPYHPLVDRTLAMTFEKSILERFAGVSRVPVINGLSNDYHPCQVLGDIFTFIEHRGPIGGRTV